MTTLYTSFNYEPIKKVTPDWERSERLQFCDQGIRKSIMRKALKLARKTK
ncbi:hypothetical protein [Lachnobacterium bovis]|uniref:Uncharacterized protein n=1 Tax=Lachnobacterium bovis TaxID=140626 RepID=A0A1H9Q1F6_9FIRM|nr:hypothetical protein [Lachnobacterium bovis]SER54270.1 hypothetical protein SAMN02910429_00410 [Lachnobacterium bovis]